MVESFATAASEAVVENLRDELDELEACELHVLWQRAAQERAAGGDMFDSLETELQQRNERQLRDVKQTLWELESAVKEYNRNHASAPSSLPARRRGKTALERAFDPFADKTLVRLGLETLDASSVRPAARKLAGWLEGLAEQTPPTTLRLLLLTHVVMGYIMVLYAWSAFGATTAEAHATQRVSTRRGTHRGRAHRVHRWPW